MKHKRRHKEDYDQYWINKVRKLAANDKTLGPEVSVWTMFRRIG
jgi:hypothetical protein